MTPSERKVFIEYLDRTTVKMTTSLRQNTFEIDKIDEEQVIDLIDLKIRFKSKYDKFYAIIDRYDGLDTSGLEIYANGGQLIQEVYFSDRSVLIKTKILE